MILLLTIPSFLGKEIVYPKYIVPYKSPFRRMWNVLILLLIFYQMVWHPMAVSFMFNEELPLAIVIFEIVILCVFIYDIFLNLKTTYSNENNEEIIDPGMLRRHYMRSYLFYLDVVTCIPIGEILLLCLIGSEKSKYTLYSFFKLISFLRIFKVNDYSKRIRVRTVFKIISIFVVYFLIVRSNFWGED